MQSSSRCASLVRQRHTSRAEMTTDQDLPMDGQSVTALFTAKGSDVTPNKDRGVIKVFCCQAFKCLFGSNLTASCQTRHSSKMGSLSPKIVKRRGHAGDQPMIGDKVTVHYTGRLLNGKKFDCTQDGKDPISFNAGKGKPIRHYCQSSVFHFNVLYRLQVKVSPLFRAQDKFSKPGMLGFYPWREEKHPYSCVRQSTLTVLLAIQTKSPPGLQ